MQGQPPANACI